MLSEVCIEHTLRQPVIFKTGKRKWRETKIEIFSHRNRILIQIILKKNRFWNPTDFSSLRYPISFFWGSLFYNLYICASWHLMHIRANIHTFIYLKLSLFLPFYLIQMVLYHISYYVPCFWKSSILLQPNLHTLEFSNFKCTLQWILNNCTQLFNKHYAHRLKDFHHLKNYLLIRYHVSISLTPTNHRSLYHYSFAFLKYQINEIKPCNLLRVVSFTLA